ncbi:rho GTPase-activating protein gacV-like [Poeciliopsis prolifica]|uniref:rho GTPase-activating protein gacV-like n=1 Tax=Poeciliopsis prolifica TaxID=188132 RepID=UPI00241402E2|nr:rho GTPase-activating protein gacV-like [Poeciliopsis prolifica]
MEEEMDDQRRLMDFTRIPKIILHRIDLWKEEVLNEPSNQEENSTLEQEKHLQMKQDQEEPEPLQMKQDQEEPEHQELKRDQEEPEHQD